MNTKQRIYQLNNKKHEALLPAMLQKVAKRHKLTAKTIIAAHCALHYNRKSNTSTLYHDGKKVQLQNSNWFVRTWFPEPKMSALITLFLKLSNIYATDEAVNTSHGIRSSKLSHAFQLATVGCKSPTTWVLPTTAFNTYKDRIIKDLSFPIVIKGQGGLGERVWLCKSKNALLKRIKELKNENKDPVILFQEFIENDGDVRVFTFKNKVIATAERHNPENFLNHIRYGGNVKAIDITSEERRIALKAAKVVGLDLAGVDIVRSKYGPLVFEVNKAPDILCFNDAVGFDISEKMFERFIETL